MYLLISLDSTCRDVRPPLTHSLHTAYTHLTHIFDGSRQTPSNECRLISAIPPIPGLDGWTIGRLDDWTIGRLEPFDGGTGGTRTLLGKRCDVFGNDGARAGVKQDSCLGSVAVCDVQDAIPVTLYAVESLRQGSRRKG